MCEELAIKRVVRPVQDHLSYDRLEATLHPLPSATSKHRVTNSGSHPSETNELLEQQRTFFVDGSTNFEDKRDKVTIRFLEAFVVTVVLVVLTVIPQGSDSSR